MISRFTIFCSICLVLLSLQYIAAQPGDRRTPEQIRKALEARLAEVEEQMNYPDRQWMYETRGKALMDLFRHSQDPIDRDSLAKRAFADFDRYEELTRGSAALSRAELHELIWRNLVPDPKSSTLALDVEVFRRSEHFDAAISVYLEMFRNQPIHNVREMSEHDWIWRYYETAANLYSFRATNLARFPTVVRAINDPQLIWEDFDKAIEFRKKSILLSGNIWFVAEIFVNKGKAAYDLGNYQLALEAYQASDDYLAESFVWFCKRHGSDDCESTFQGIVMKPHVVRVSFLRAKAHMKNGDYEEAVSNLNYYITDGPAYVRNCAQLYRLRGQAYSKLRQIGKAHADLQKAASNQGYDCGGLEL